MPLVPEPLASWLKSSSRTVSALDAGIAAAWADLASVTSISSPLADGAGAAAEAARQLAFLAPPKAIDVLRVPGQRSDLIGRAITATADRSGYEAGVVVFVIAADELADESETDLRVIRRLA